MAGERGRVAFPLSISSPSFVWVSFLPFCLFFRLVVCLSLYLSVLPVSLFLSSLFIFPSDFHLSVFRPLPPSICPPVFPPSSVFWSICPSMPLLPYLLFLPSLYLSICRLLFSYLSPHFHLSLSSPLCVSLFLCLCIPVPSLPLCLSYFICLSPSLRRCLSISLPLPFSLLGNTIYRIVIWFDPWLWPLCLLHHRQRRSFPPIVVTP